MKIINSFKKFKINENDSVDSPSSCKASSLTGEVTLYRLTSHKVLDLSAPGEFYFSDMDNVNPEFLKNKDSNELFLITVKCDSSNIDLEKSEMECGKLSCDCVVAVKDDKACEVISVEPYKG